MHDPGSSSALIDPAADIGCAECGYLLGGLPVEGRCPECATPVAESLARPRLQDGGVTWLGSVRRGAGVLALAVISTVVFGIAEVYRLQRVEDGGRGLNAALCAASMTACIALSGVLFWGVCRLTVRPGGSASLASDLGRLRPATRGLAGIAIVCEVAYLLYHLVYTVRTEDWAEDHAPAWADALAAASEIIMGLSATATAIYAARLARRGRDSLLAKLFAAVAGGWAIGLVGVAAFSIAEANFPTLLDHDWMVYLLLTALAALLAAPVGSVVALVMLRRLLARTATSQTCRKPLAASRRYETKSGSGRGAGGRV